MISKNQEFYSGNFFSLSVLTNLLINYTVWEPFVAHHAPSFHLIIFPPRSDKCYYSWISWIHGQLDFELKFQILETNEALIFLFGNK